MGTLSLAAPLVLFKKSGLWAGPGFHLLPSFHHHHPTQHNYTTQTVTHTVMLTSTSYSTLYRYSTTRNMICPSGAWFKKTTLNAIYLPCTEPETHNSVVGWHWNTHTQIFVTIFILPILCMDYIPYQSVLNIVLYHVEDHHYLFKDNLIFQKIQFHFIFYGYLHI